MTEKMNEVVCSLCCENPLKIHENEIYAQNFKDLVSDLPTIPEDKFKTLICANKEYNKFSFNQGISELLLYFLFSKYTIPYLIEKNKNIGNGSNVDISLEYGGIQYNFEVKSPEYFENSDNMIHGKFDCRFGDKSINDAVMNDLIQQMSKNIGSSQFTGVTTDNMTDNKVKDCLLSAQNKFPEPSNTVCNILFVSTTTFELISYWDYIVNPYSGFFNIASDVSSFTISEKDKTPINKTMYDKVTAVVLSNAISLNERYDETSWDLSNSVNIVLTNPLCKNVSIGGLQMMSNFLPHKTCEYVCGLRKFQREKPGVPEHSFLSDFMANYGFGLNSKSEEELK